MDFSDQTNQDQQKPTDFKIHFIHGTTEKYISLNNFFKGSAEPYSRIFKEIFKELTEPYNRLKKSKEQQSLQCGFLRSLKFDFFKCFKEHIGFMKTLCSRNGGVRGPSET